MCGTPQRSRSTVTSFSRPGSTALPSNCGSGRYTSHQMTAPPTTTTIPKTQNTIRKMVRKPTLSNDEFEFRRAGAPAQLTPVSAASKVKLAAALPGRQSEAAAKGSWLSAGGGRAAVFDGGGGVVGVRLFCALVVGR